MRSAAVPAPPSYHFEAGKLNAPEAAAPAVNDLASNRNQSTASRPYPLTSLQRSAESFLIYFNYLS